MKRPRWAVCVSGAIVLLLLADGVAWLAAERALAAGIARWAGTMAGQGVAVAVGPATPGGFPFAASRRVSLRLRAGHYELNSGQVVLTVSPTQPGRLRVTLPAPVTLTAPGLPSLAFASPDWRLTIALPDADAIAVDARDLSATWAAPDGQGLQAGAALLHAQAQPEAAALDLVASAQSVTLPEPAAGGVLPLGRHLASVAFEALLAGRLPPPSGAGTWPDAAAMAAWRDGGGAIELRRLALGYGPLGLSGTGRVALDAQLQPRADAALTVLGYAETLDALVAGHTLSAHAAQAAGAVLGLLARPPEGGGAPQVALDVHLSDRVLTAAGFPLLRLPMLNWPAGAR